MKLYVARHCSTECSEKKIYCGRADISLSARGREEAALLREETKGYELDLIFSSPLLRARQTAEAVARGRNIPILFDDRLKERDFGTFEGKSVETPAGKVCRYSFAMSYPCGESNLQVAARVYAFLDELKARHAEKRVFVVSHGSACRIIRSYFVPMTDAEFFAYSQPNGTVETYEL